MENSISTEEELSEKNKQILQGKTKTKNVEKFIVRAIWYFFANYFFLYPKMKLHRKK